MKQLSQVAVLIALVAASAYIVRDKTTANPPVKRLATPKLGPAKTGFSILGLQCGMTREDAYHYLSQYAEPKVLKGLETSGYFPELELSETGLEMLSGVEPLIVNVRFLRGTSIVGQIFCRHSVPDATIEVDGRVRVRAGDSRENVMETLRPYVYEESQSNVYCRDANGQDLMLHFISDGQLVLFALGQTEPATPKPVSRDGEPHR